MIPLVLLVLIILVSGFQRQTRKDQLESAAACNGSLSATDIRSAAERAAADGSISLDDAERQAMILACPAMAKNLR